MRSVENGKQVRGTIKKETAPDHALSGAAFQKKALTRFTGLPLAWLLYVFGFLLSLFLPDPIHVGNLFIVLLLFLFAILGTFITHIKLLL
jgi:hypothetical protein